MSEYQRSKYETKTFVKLINVPSPNSICLLNETLFITSLQCGIYSVLLRDIDFEKIFGSPSFFSPFVAKSLGIFENISLTQIVSMTLVPNDEINLNESPVSNLSISHSSSSPNGLPAPFCVLPNMLFVIDIEFKLY